MEDEIEKTIAQLSIWKCGQGIGHRCSIKLSRTYMNLEVSALWKGLMLYWLNLKLKAIFYQYLTNDSPLKLWKMLFISSKNLFSF